MSTPSSPSSDSVVDQVLTQQARPSRRAGKKAMEEMSRETQRMARNMHLQHQAITKKKITMQSLLDRFNFKPSAEEGSLLPTPPATSSTLESVAEIVRSTEPSSPSTSCNPADGIDVNTHEDGDRVCGNDHVPDNAQLIEEYSPPAVPLSVATTLPSTLLGRFQQGHIDQNSEAGGSGRASEQEVKVKRPKRVLNRPWLRRTLVPKHSSNPDSDSELEIIPVSRAKAALSAHIPVGKENESHSLLVLRACAQLNQPDEPAPHLAKRSMTLAEMQAMLRQRARKQGISERLEYLDELRKRGIVPQTAEERAKEEATIEMLVEKARLEAEAIQKQERATARKEGKEGSEDEFLDDSSDYEEAEWHDELELSGSEEDNMPDEEDTGDVETDEDEDARELANAESPPTAAVETTPEAGQRLLIQNDTRPIANHENDVNEADSDGQSTTFMGRPSRRVRQIISDDEEGISTPPPSTVQVPKSVEKLDVPKVSIAQKPVLGLTQLFAGTMAQEQIVDPLSTPDSVQQPENQLDFLRQLSAPSLPCSINDIIQAQNLPQEELIVRDSHPLSWRANSRLTSLGDELYDASPSPDPTDMFSAPQALPSPTQILDIPDPTQDVGFSHLRYTESQDHLPTPLGTVETLLSPSQVSLTKKSAARRLVKRNGKCVGRRARVSSESDAADGDESDIDGASDEREHIGPLASANDVLLKGTNTANASEVPMFDKRKSHAKELVDEHAEESEDEYAGLGGASDDDNRSDNEDEDMSDLLDDEAQDIDEQELAALMADKNRADDKRRFERLYNDVTTGALRRRRSDELDLSDSDYGEEARRRIKRREESKMRRALLAADENMGKIATNPKKSAFFRSIEDRDEEVDMDEDIDEPTAFLDEPSTDRVFNFQKCDNVGSIARPDGSPGNNIRQTNDSRKRPREDLSDDESSPPRRLRRHKNYPALKILTSAAEVRATLSAMLAPPNAVVSGPSCMDLDSEDDEKEEDDDEKQAHESSSSANHDASKGFGTKSSSNVVNPFSLARRALAARQDQRGICEGVGAEKKKSQVIDRLTVRRQSAKTTSASDGPRLAFLASKIIAPGHVGARGGRSTRARPLVSFQSSTRTSG